jgi:hypothetical protein
MSDLRKPAGTKFDTEKPRLDLLSGIALTGTASVLTFGALKYDAHNWRKGFQWSRIIASLLRHSIAFMMGEDIDPESGLPHVDHIGCNAMFLQEMYRTHKDLDDRHKTITAEPSAQIQQIKTNAS